MNQHQHSAGPMQAQTAASVQPTLIVCIVNWRTADLTVDSLQSMEEEVRALGRCLVYIVDNDSQDGSAEKIESEIERRSWGAWARCIRAGANLGFAGGNNVAIRAALRDYKPEFFLLLNPDTIVRPGAFRILLDYMRAHPQVGIAGGRSEDPDATPQHCCFRFPNPIGELSTYLSLGVFDRLFRRFLTRIETPDQPCDVDWVSGALMMVRTAVFEQIGLMDEGYFLYYEETDFILRARRAGWICRHVPQSRVVHLVGQSSGVTARGVRPARRPPYWFESRRRYFQLNYGRAYAICVDLFALTGLWLHRLRELIERRPNPNPPYFIRDLIRHGAIFNGRRSLKPRATLLR